MSYELSLAHGRKRVEEFHRKTGVPCTVSGLTYYSATKLYGPPRVVKAVDVYMTIISLASLTDPDVASMVRELNISYNAYRRITCPYDVVAIVRDDRIFVQPIVSGSRVYQVVEVVADDENAPVELVMHCQKV